MPKSDFLSLFMNIPIVWIIFVGALLLGLAISVSLTIWVFQDANKRGMNGIIWGLVVFIAGLIGLVLYLVVRQQIPNVNESNHRQSPYSKENAPRNETHTQTSSTFPVLGCLVVFMIIFALAIVAIIGIPFAMKQIERNKVDMAIEAMKREDQYAKQKEADKIQAQIVEVERLKKLEEQKVEDEIKRQKKEEKDKLIYAEKSVPRLFPTLAKTLADADPDNWVGGNNYNCFCYQNGESPTFVVDRQVGFRKGDTVLFKVRFSGWDVGTDRPLQHEESITKTVDIDGITAVWLKYNTEYRPPISPRSHHEIGMNYYFVVVNAFYNKEPVCAVKQANVDDPKTIQAVWYLSIRNVPPANRFDKKR
jgi:hypothetical protein